MFLLNIFFKKSLTIFCYHDVTDSPSEFCGSYDLFMTPNTFNYQIGFIKKHFNVINPDQLLNGELPNNAALVTFDDGYQSFFTNAIPILDAHQVPCLIFLNMGPINGEISSQGLTHYLCEKREDFILHLKKSVNLPVDLPPFLSCSQSIVNSYLKYVGESFEKQVAEFVGPLPTADDLIEASKNNLIYYGNHLYHHDVPILMSENELLDSFQKNKKELEKFPNYRNLFAFPFGQPGTCFSEKQTDILLENGAKKIFRSSATINSDPSFSYLDRLSLSSYENSSVKILFQLLKCQVRTLITNL